jgi:hypothetical protein
LMSIELERPSASEKPKYLATVTLLSKTITPTSLNIGVRWQC